jgi:hypothetical protein
MSADFMSILEDLIPEIIPSQRRLTNMCPIFNVYGNTGLSNVICSVRRGHIHRQTSVP